MVAGYEAVDKSTITMVINRYQQTPMNTNERQEMSNKDRQGLGLALTSRPATASNSCMQILPTEFDGHRFRSRTEARWAAFFKAASIRYEYEPEGYNLPSGWYIPDFFLPDIRTFVEIKGRHPSSTEQRKCEDLSAETHCNVVIGIGQPDTRNDLRLIMPMPVGECVSYDFDPTRSEIHSSHLFDAMRSVKSERFGIKELA